MAKIRKPVSTPTGIPTVQVRKFGDWARAHLTLANLDSAVIAGYMSAQMSAAKKLKRIVRRNIRHNGGSTYWPEVSEQYAEWKESYGYDPGDLLYLTGLYYNNIDIWTKGNNTFVGLKSHTRNYFTSGKTLQFIAAVLENGTAKMPARPLWGPSLKELGGGRRIRGLVVWHIRNQIRAQTGTSAKITF